MRKSSFLTFCFAFIPGAGEMYLGMMKKGVTVMTAFWGLIGIAGYLRLEFLYFALPIIWFYSFFETFNIRHLSYEQILMLDQSFFENLSAPFAGNLRSALEKRHVWIGIALVIIGFWAVFSNFVMPSVAAIVESLGYDSWFAMRLLGRIPSAIVSIGIVLFGVYLVRGKKRKPELEKDYVEYKGDHHE